MQTPIYKSVVYKHAKIDIFIQSRVNQIVLCKLQKNDILLCF